MGDSFPVPLSAEQQANINNLRAIIKRQLRPTSTVDVELVADVLIEHATLMRDAGLASELLGYLEQVQYRLAENTPRYARLLVEIAVTMNATGARQEADVLFHQTLDLYATLDGNVVWEAYAKAHVQYGRFLLERGQLQEAVAHYQQAIHMLNHADTQVAMAEAQNELGLALTGRGQFNEALPYFEQALAALNQHGITYQQARTQADFAAALIQLGQLDRAETLLQSSLETCEMLGAWALRGQVRHLVAYVDQARAEATKDANGKQRFLERAENTLNQAIADLLPLHNSTELAVVYHDLSRLEARQRKFNEAEAHVRMCSEMFARLGNRRNFAVAQITFGQMLMLKSGDASAAIDRIRQALKIAGELGDKHTQHQAAESLVRIHRIQAKRATEQGQPPRYEVLDQLSHTRSRFESLRLDDSVKALDEISAGLQA